MSEFARLAKGAADLAEHVSTITDRLLACEGRLTALESRAAPDAPAGVGNTGDYPITLTDAQDAEITRLRADLEGESAIVLDAKEALGIAKDADLGEGMEDLRAKLEAAERERDALRAAAREVVDYDRAYTVEVGLAERICALRALLDPPCPDCAEGGSDG